MKTKLVGFAVLTTLVLLPRLLQAQTWTLDVSALIDGRDQLIIQSNTLTWHHFEWAAVGRHDGLNEPTVITTTLDGNVGLDHFNWIPDWPEPPPAEIRYEAFSSTFSMLTPAMPEFPTFVSLDAIQARGSLTIEQYPSTANNFTTILEFNDNDVGSHDIYSARVVFSTVPEPSVGMMIVAIALFGLVSRVRKIQI